MLYYVIILEIVLELLLALCYYGRDISSGPVAHDKSPTGKCYCFFLEGSVMAHARAKGRRELDSVSSHLNSHEKSNSFH